MDGRKKIFLHIGTHRTGSTSLQRYLVANRRRLRRAGYDLYRGEIEANNHIELYLAAMRPERDSAAKQKYDLAIDDHFVAAVQARVHRFLAASRQPSVLFTCEGLSLLRSEDELARLTQILDHPRHDVVVVLVLRDRDDFLRSYKRQMLKTPGRTLSQDKRSAFYVAPDSWLADFDTLIARYEAAFGTERLRIVDYDREVANNGDALPGVMQAFDLGPEQLPQRGGYWLNASNDAGGNRTPLRRAKDWLVRKLPR